MLICGAWTERVFQATRSDRLPAFYISPGFGHHIHNLLVERSHLVKLCRGVRSLAVCTIRSLVCPNFTGENTAI